MSISGRISPSLSDDLLRQSREWAGEPPEPSASGVVGWTLDDLKRAARYAASRCRIPATSCLDDPVRLAESGVGYAIAANPSVEWVDAIAAGQAEIWNASKAWRRGVGISLTGSRAPAARFWIYWQQAESCFPSPTGCEERIALHQVIGALPAKHLDTLLLLAFTDSTEDAAAIAGVTTSGFLHRAQRARKAALDLWYDHEEPPSIRRLPTQRRSDRRTCPQGHEISGENVRWETVNGRRYKRCRTCRVTRDDARRRRASA